VATVADVVAELVATALSEEFEESVESSELHAVIPRAATRTPAATSDLRMITVVGPFASGLGRSIPAGTKARLTWLVRVDLPIPGLL